MSIGGWWLIVVGVLLLLFLGLKATGLIPMSWFCVLSPVWGSCIILVGLLALAIIDKALP